MDLTKFFMAAFPGGADPFERRTGDRQDHAGHGVHYPKRIEREPGNLLGL